MRGAMPPFPYRPAWRGAWSSTWYVFMTRYFGKMRTVPYLTLLYLTRKMQGECPLQLFPFVSLHIHH